MCDKDSRVRKVHELSLVGVKIGTQILVPELPRREPRLGSCISFAHCLAVLAIVFLERMPAVHERAIAIMVDRTDGRDLTVVIDRCDTGRKRRIHCKMRSRGIDGLTHAVTQQCLRHEMAIVGQRTPQLDELRLLHEADSQLLRAI